MNAKVNDQKCSSNAKQDRIIHYFDLRLNISILLSPSCMAHNQLDLPKAVLHLMQLKTAAAMHPLFSLIVVGKY